MRIDFESARLTGYCSEWSVHCGLCLQNKTACGLCRTDIFISFIIYTKECSACLCFLLAAWGTKVTERSSIKICVSSGHMNDGINTPPGCLDHEGCGQCKAMNANMIGAPATNNEMLIRPRNVTIIGNLDQSPVPEAKNLPNPFDKAFLSRHFLPFPLL